MRLVTQLDDAVLVAGGATLLDVPAPERADRRHRNVPLRGIGVRTADDRVAEGGQGIYRHRATSPVSLADLGQPPALMPGGAIFGGVVGPQFGHVVSQSIGRLWVAEALPADLPILFLNANPGFDRLPGYFTDLVRNLGVENPLRLITAPTRVARLHLGPDLCNLERRPSADPAFLGWLQRRRPAPEIDPGLSVYVSRSRMGPTVGHYLQERVIEEALAREGYVVIHPETMTIHEQVALYRRAGRLVFADGSAVHLWSLFASPEQRAAIILRRVWLGTFRLWFQSFDFARVAVLDRVIAGFHGPGPNGRQSAALLDLESLWCDLAEAGFHSGSQRVAGAKAWFEAGAAGDFSWDEVSAGLLAARPEFTRVGP